MTPAAARRLEAFPPAVAVAISAHAEVAAKSRSHLGPCRMLSGLRSHLHRLDVARPVIDRAVAELARRTGLTEGGRHAV